MGMERYKLIVFFLICFNSYSQIVKDDKNNTTGVIINVHETYERIIQKGYESSEIYQYLINYYFQKKCYLKSFYYYNILVDKFNIENIDINTKQNIQILKEKFMPGINKIFLENNPRIKSGLMSIKNHQNSLEYVVKIDENWYHIFRQFLTLQEPKITNEKILSEIKPDKLKFIWVIKRISSINDFRKYDDLKTLTISEELSYGKTLQELLQNFLNNGREEKN